ncbi:OmpA family protein [Dyadobacter psychrotolerans]|uniref:OmpA family protein n=1 Tax=Dyadobacter psychrotolerans TaxID=2541721 RepID=A0A4R5DN22_9BACT|nr:OmpA family protein [Dyadobacter psychrotolerans]TDE15579.1 OmpA family protein [Dyadobacter psychrotolerans]
MAELDVQPKRKSPWWIWVTLILVILALIFFVRGCGETNPTASSATDSTSQISAATSPSWDSVDFDAPNATYEEITDTSISVRGTDKYTIYGLGENILFETGQDQVQGNAKDKLDQISKSIEKRFKGYWIAVYGNTDSTGDPSQNKQLSEKRAEAVRSWLIDNAGVTKDRISLGAMGEENPVASNATEKGRKMNRRVEIVVMNP